MPSAALALTSTSAVRPAHHRQAAPGTRAPHPASGVVTGGAATRDAEEPAHLAERLFGAATHVVLVSDGGPALSIVGWTLGTGRAEVSDDRGASRTVVAEVMYSEAGHYVVYEHQIAQGGDATPLAATVNEFRTAPDLWRYSETGSFDSARDIALATAVDHASRVWPWLRRGPARRAVSAMALPFAL